MFVRSHRVMAFFMPSGISYILYACLHMCVQNTLVLPSASLTRCLRRFPATPVAGPRPQLLHGWRRCLLDDVGYTLID